MSADVEAPSLPRSLNPPDLAIRPGYAFPLILKLAARNLFQDRLRFIATVIGIVFSIGLKSLHS